MGDLKKKNVDYIVRSNSGEDILIESREISTENETIERLRSYMKIFYEMQKEKETSSTEDEGVTHGKV